MSGRKSDQNDCERMTSVRRCRGEGFSPRLTESPGARLQAGRAAAAHSTPAEGHTAVTVTIYHNPRCSKSRATLQLLLGRGIEPRVVEYLETPPDDRELRRILAMLGLRPRQLLRPAEAKAAGLDDPALDDDALIRGMLNTRRRSSGPSWSRVIALASAGRRSGCWNCSTTNHEKPAGLDPAGAGAHLQVMRVSMNDRGAGMVAGAVGTGGKMRLGRRGFLTGAMLGGAALALPSAVAAALLPTPRQMEGPFYPPVLPLDDDADLLSVAGRSGQAQGTPTHVLGRVVDPEGRPVAGARIEILAVRCVRPLPPPALRRHRRSELPGLRGRHRRCRRRLAVPHDPPGALSGTHAAHPLRRAAAGRRAVHDSDVRRGRAAERPRFPPVARPRSSGAGAADRAAGRGRRSGSRSADRPLRHRARRRLRGIPAGPLNGQVRVAAARLPRHWQSP